MSRLPRSAGVLTGHWLWCLLMSSSMRLRDPGTPLPDTNGSLHVRQHAVYPCRAGEVTRRWSPPTCRSGLGALLTGSD